MPEGVKKLREFFGVPKIDDFRSFGDFLKSPAMKWFLILAFAIVATFLMTFTVQRIPQKIEEGAIATRDIKADRNYEIVDEETTNKLKQEASQSIESIYNFDEGITKNVVQRIHSAFDATRRQSQGMVSKDKKHEIPEAKVKEIRESFSKDIGVDVPSEQVTALLKENFSPRVEQTLFSILSNKLSQPIVAEKGTFASERDRGIILRHIHTENGEIVIGKETSIADPNQIPTTDDIRQRISKMVVPREKFHTPEVATALIALAQSLIVPNLSFDMEETNKRREATEAGIQDVIIKIKPGEMIVRNGSRFEARHIKIINGIKKESGQGIYPTEFLGTTIFIILSIVVLFYFAERYIRRFHPSRTDYFLMGILALINLLVMRIGFSLVPVIHDVLFIDIPSSALLYGVPVASGAMLIRMFLHPEDSFFFAVFISLLNSIFSEADLSFVVFCFISNVAGIIAISNADKRSAIMKAGVIAGGVGSLAILGIRLVGMTTAATQLIASDIIWHMLCALCGGIWCAILIMITAPVIESLLGYTSDIKLLELANLNHPLLRELIVRAPGTYHHSHLVGILAEAAAEAIGANPLLVRVGAYYHDIGKIRKPLYFVENAKDGEDRHAKLSPHMSALIVSSHVKEGIELGEDAGLPKSIINMIPQHHGTRKISFFFEKAKAQAQTEDAPIDESDFIYPGPKPQTREAAILMLADVVEASVRSLKEKGTVRIQQTVQRVINDCFADEQLNECELTLHDLNEIAKSFIHILLGLYHQRIEYPKETRPTSEVSVVDEETFIEDQPPKPAPKAASTARTRQKGS